MECISDFEAEHQPLPIRSAPTTSGPSLRTLSTTVCTDHGGRERGGRLARSRSAAAPSMRHDRVMAMQEADYRRAALLTRRPFRSKMALFWRGRVHLERGRMRGGETVPFVIGRCGKRGDGGAQSRRGFVVFADSPDRSAAGHTVVSALSLRDMEG
jgi:hypothetical protein